MIDKIKQYLIVASSLVAAVFIYLFLKRGEKIKDLQYKVLKDKLDDQSRELKEKGRKSVHEYIKAKTKYERVRAAYRSQQPPKDPS